MELDGFTFEMFRVVQERFVFYLIDFTNNSLTQWNCTRTCLIWYCSHISWRRSNSPFSAKVTIKYSKQRNSDLQHFENSAIAKILQQCKLTMWDECTMAHKKSLEALDRTTKYLRNNQNRFGGAILLAGDFRQTISVILRQRQWMKLNACVTFDWFR